MIGVWFQRARLYMKNIMVDRIQSSIEIFSIPPPDYASSLLPPFFSSSFLPPSLPFLPFSHPPKKLFLKLEHFVLTDYTHWTTLYSEIDENHQTPAVGGKVTPRQKDKITPTSPTVPMTRLCVGHVSKVRLWLYATISDHYTYCG